MADSVATRVARHRAKKRTNDVTRLTLELDRAAVTTLRRLCRVHGKTQRQFVEMAVHAADNLLAGRLQVAKAAAKPTTRVIIRADPQERPQAHDQCPENANTPPTGPRREPELAIIDADASIRAAAFRIEP